MPLVGLSRQIGKCRRGVQVVRKDSNRSLARFLLAPKHLRPAGRGSSRAQVLRCGCEIPTQRPRRPPWRTVM